MGVPLCRSRSDRGGGDPVYFYSQAEMVFCGGGVRGLGWLFDGVRQERVRSLSYISERSSRLRRLLSLLFFIPAPKRKKKGKLREERLFEKFREELTDKSFKRGASMPPKVCCFNQEPEGGVTAQEYGVSLSYADTLLKKLRSKKLKAGDRLETEELLRRLDCYREKPLDVGERSSLNDCLASILKLTAKYQL